MATAVTRDEQLAWEKRFAMPAAASAFGFVVLTVGVSFIGTALFKAPPGSARPATLLAIAEQPSGWLWASVVQSLPVLTLIPVLLYLERAAAFRAEVMKAARALAVVGPLLLVALGVANALAISDLAKQFAATPEAKVVSKQFPAEKATAPANADSLGQTVGESVSYTAQMDQAGATYEELIAAGGPRSIVAGIAQAGALAIGFALILISQAGLKAGLTSRFLGFIGIAVGAFYGLGALFTALGLGGQFSPLVLEVFWLGALALIFLDRWPNGRGPAWDTGEATPWPTAQEQREAYERRVESRRDQIESGSAEPPASAGNGSGGPAPGSRKRKKKRR